MIALNPLSSKIKHSARAFALATLMSFALGTAALASDALEDCSDPECESALRTREVMFSSFRQSDDPLLHFLADKNAETAAALFAQPHILMQEPLLTRLAINELAEPSAERHAIQVVAKDRAFALLAQLDGTNTPEENDLILKAALASTDWREGFVETARRVHKVLVKNEAWLREQHAQYKSAESAPVRVGDPKITEQSMVYITAISIAAANLPEYQHITTICRAPALLETLSRRDLCVAIGRSFEQRSDTLISALIGLAIQKNAAESATELAQIKLRRSAWDAFAQMALETSASPDPEDGSEREVTQKELDYAKSVLALGEIPAMLKAYKTNPKADDAVLALIQAARSQP